MHLCSNPNLSNFDLLEWTYLYLLLPLQCVISFITACRVCHTPLSSLTGNSSYICLVWLINSCNVVREFLNWWHCHAQKMPRSSTFKSELLGGCSLIATLIPSSRDLVINSGKAVETVLWGGTLSCWIKSWLYNIAIGHCALIAGNNLSKISAQYLLPSTL